MVKALRGTHTSWFMWWLRANGRYLVPTGGRHRSPWLCHLPAQSAAIHLEFGILALLLGGLDGGFDLLVWWGLQAWAWHSSVCCLSEVVAIPAADRGCCCLPCCCAGRAGGRRALVPDLMVRATV